MKRRSLLFLLIGMLPVLLAAATASPTAGMFKGQVASLEADGGSLPERAAAACRRWQGEKPGSVFFTAWAFPACESIRSCGRRSAGGLSETVALRVRDNRISMQEHGRDGLTISGQSGEEKDPVSWGVLLFLHQIRDGSCQVLDMDVLASDRTYALGGERLAWLGSTNEEHGLDFLRTLPASAGKKLREKLAFVLYLFNGEAAVADLIGLARRDPDMEVRKGAIFWLGQKASAAAVAALAEVLAAPEALEIKKAAVFALSQLPPATGTPMLLRIARQNPHPRLRKEAIFWLGQSGDPRALDFFEEILLK
ncbi:MAG: HEAT repeat domain-containing protein [Acidobacteria bacterium]|jgi:hypothetical protein|nr:HEAT repeat domain-containing protein [Acidobacteriota bacterium]